jgi:excisionase family DNA binding protein
MPTRTTSQPVYLTPDEAAARYNFARERLMRWAREGKCPSIKAGGRLIRFEQGAMDAWMAAQARGNTA